MRHRNVFKNLYFDKKLNAGPSSISRLNSAMICFHDQIYNKIINRILFTKVVATNQKPFHV